MSFTDSHDESLRSPIARRPLSIPDDVVERVSYYLYANDDYVTLLLVQRISRAGYDAATPLIYRDIHLKSDRQWRSLLNAMVSDYSLSHQQTEGAEGAMWFPSPCDDSIPNVTPSQTRTLKAYSYTHSLTLDEFPSNHAIDLGLAARKIVHLATGRHFLFPSVKMICITGRAPYLYRNNFIEWHTSDGGLQVPQYLSKDDGLGTLLNPSHFCITQPQISLDFPCEAEFAADYLSTRAFGFLVDRLQDIFPHLETADLHGIVPHPTVQFILPRCDVRIFISAADSLSPHLYGYPGMSPIAVDWLLVMIQADFQASRGAPGNYYSRRLVGWERLPGRLLPLSWGGDAVVPKTMEMVAEALSSGEVDCPLLVIPNMSGNRIDFDEDAKTLASISFPADMEPCMVCGGELSESINAYSHIDVFR